MCGVSSSDEKGEKGRKISLVRFVQGAQIYRVSGNRPRDLLQAQRHGLDSGTVHHRRLRSVHTKRRSSRSRLTYPRPAQCTGGFLLFMAYMLGYRYGSKDETYACAYGKPPFAPRARGPKARGMRVRGSPGVPPRMRRMRPLPWQGGYGLRGKGRGQICPPRQERRQSSGVEVVRPHSSALSFASLV